MTVLSSVAADPGADPASPDGPGAWAVGTLRRYLAGRIAPGVEPDIRLLGLPQPAADADPAGCAGQAPAAPRGPIPTRRRTPS